MTAKIDSWKAARFYKCVCLCTYMYKYTYYTYLYAYRPKRSLDVGIPRKVAVGKGKREIPI